MSERLRMLLVFGTRPEAIKMAPVFHALASSQKFEVKIAVTGQHREMLDQVLKVFEICPDFDLNLMRADQDLSELTGRIVVGIRDICKQWRSDWIFVHGDTTTAMATSLAAFYQRIPVAHVEAGLRTRQVYSPYPEEMNRQIVGRLAAKHFAPTRNSMRNLIAEGISAAQIEVTGNTVIDALKMIVDKIEADPDLKGYLSGKYKFLNPEKKWILITAHRRENFNEGMANIAQAIRLLARRSDIEIIFPVHLNPNVSGPIRQNLDGLTNVHLLNPLEYTDFIYIMKTSKLILTDSGGIQEEAPSLGIPVLVMRDTSERPEAIAAGTAELVGTDPQSIVDAASAHLEGRFESRSVLANPYGNGDAACKIARHFEAYVETKTRTSEWADSKS